MFTDMSYDFDRLGPKTRFWEVGVRQMLLNITASILTWPPASIHFVMWVWDSLNQLEAEFS